MNRRGFLSGILAAGVAPAFIGSSVLMPVRQIWKPDARLIQAQTNALLDAAERAINPPVVIDEWRAYGGAAGGGGKYRDNWMPRVGEVVLVDGRPFVVTSRPIGSGPSIWFDEAGKWT